MPPKITEGIEATTVLMRGGSRVKVVLYVSGSAREFQ